MGKTLFSEVKLMGEMLHGLPVLKDLNGSLMR